MLNQDISIYSDQVTFNLQFSKLFCMSAQIFTTYIFGILYVYLCFLGCMSQAKWFEGCSIKEISQDNTRDASLMYSGLITNWIVMSQY